MEAEAEAKKKASVRIFKKMKEARRLFDECVKISEESGVMFDLPWGGEGTDEAGLGGTYLPTTASYLELDNYSDRYDRAGWLPSAGSC